MVSFCFCFQSLEGRSRTDSACCRCSSPCALRNSLFRICQIPSFWLQLCLRFAALATWSAGQPTSWTRTARRNRSRPLTRNRFALAAFVRGCLIFGLCISLFLLLRMHHRFALVNLQDCVLVSGGFANSWTTITYTRKASCVQ